MCFVFYECLEGGGGGGGRKKKQNKNKTKEKNKRRLPQSFTRMAEQRTFWQRNRHRACACRLPQCFFAKRDMDVNLSVHY